MNNIESKLISDFKALGCSQQNAAATYQIFLNLTEVRRLFDVNYHFHKDLKRMYFTARNTKNAPLQIFVPVCATENLSFNLMQKILQISENESVALAIISPDTNCSIYKITKGLETINASESTSTSTLKQRQQHDIELNTKRGELEQFLNYKTALPPNINDDGSNVIVGPISRQWYNKDWRLSC